MLPVYIRAGHENREKLSRRFASAPKPMYFNEAFLRKVWEEYLDGRAPDSANPSDFLRFAFARLLDWRIPRYESLAQNWAVTIDADRIAAIDTGAEFDEALSDAIRERTSQSRAVA